MSTSSPSTDPPRPVTSEAASVQILEGHDVIGLGGVEWLVVRSVAEDADAFIAAIEASLNEVVP